MTKPVVLDSGPLGRIAHPRPNPDIMRWLQQLVESGTTVIIPEIADYEVRRSLLFEGLTKSLARLDELKNTLTYLPLTTTAMLRAAELWAAGRKQGPSDSRSKGIGR